MRDQLLVMMCAGHGRPTQQRRGIGDLPRQVTAPVADTLVRSLDAAGLARRLVPTLTALAP